MQDRFKFRYFNKYANTMIEPKNWRNIDEIYECIKQQVCFDEDIPHISYNHIGKNGLVFMQSTGLKDKNGKLIYEGDIVQFYDDEFLQTMKIVWDDDELDFKAIGLKTSIECYGQDFLYLGYIKKEDNLEVIGNIYKNPELLKERN